MEPSQSCPATSELPRVPIVVGVSGHRNYRIEDEPLLRDALARTLREFRSSYPRTPLILLSSLAEGADLLAAEVALQLGENDPVGITVRAPLPFPAEIYPASTSFDTEAGRLALQRILNHPRTTSFVVPLPEEETPIDTAGWLRAATDRVEPKPRQRCYANAGGYVVRHCHIIIALWDGDTEPKDAQGRAKTSGTAEFVSFKLNGLCPSAYPWPEPLGYLGECGPVIVIHTPRLGRESKQQAGERELWLPGCATPLRKPPFAARERAARRFWRRAVAALGFTSRVHEGNDSTGIVRRQQSELRQFHETCQTVDDFNRDATKAGSKITRRLNQAEQKIADQLEVMKSSKLHSKLYELARLREAASELAGYLDSKLAVLQGGVFAAIFLAVLTFHLYAHHFRIVGGHPEHDRVWLVFFVASLFVAGGLVAWVWWQRIDIRRLDYRALAEALRVRIFWGISGIGRSVADSYLGQLRGEMTWARRALQHVCPPPQHWAEDFQSSSKDVQYARLAVVRNDWVKSQSGWFEKKHREFHKFAAWCRGGGFAFAAVGWGLALYLSFQDCGQLTVPTASAAERPVTTATHTIWCARHPDHWILILSGLLAAGGGLWIAFGERRSYEELAKQYERIHSVFVQGDRALGICLNQQRLEEAGAILERLGHEAITEHAHWLILRRARPFELPIY